MTTILAIDTTTGPCSVAVWHENRIAAYVENTKPVMQSASLMPLIEEALEAAGIGYPALSAVACTVGPGSFTGIRVGLAAARGIAFAVGIEKMGFTTLDVLIFAGRPYAKGRPVLALLNAGKGEYYYQAPGGEPLLGTRESAMAAITAPALIVGNMTADSPITFPRADALAALAASGAAPLPLSPFYIRPPDAKLPRPGGA